MTIEKKVSKLDALKASEREKAFKVEAARNKKIVKLLNEMNSDVLDAVLDVIDMDKNAEGYEEAKAKIAAFILTSQSEDDEPGPDSPDDAQEPESEPRAETAYVIPNRGYASAEIPTE